MPRRPDTPCKHPGCPRLVPYGQKYCEEHAPIHSGDRPSAANRGYGAAWRRARKQYLEGHPLCVECMKEGKYVQATDVDHVVPHRGDPILFWDRGNWQALCHSHHSIKTGTRDMHPEYHF